MTNIQQEIAELKQRLAELEAKVSDSTGLEWPQVGEDVYFLETSVIEKAKWRGDRALSLQSDYYNKGLIFRTSEEAERADKKRIAIAKWNRLAGDQSWINWSEDGYKYYPFYNHVQEAWFIDSNEDWQVWPFAHHKSKADCEAAIKAMGEKMNWLLY